MPGKKRGHSQVDALEEPRTTTNPPEPLQEALKIANSYVPPSDSEPTSRDLVIPLVLEYLNTHPGSDRALSNVGLFGSIIEVLNRKVPVGETKIQSLRAELLYRLRLVKRATLIASFLPGKRVCEEWQWLRQEEPLDQVRHDAVGRAVQSVDILPKPKCGEGFSDPKVHEFLIQVCYDLKWKPSRINQKLRQIKRIIDKATPDHNLTEHISASAKVGAF